MKKINLKKENIKFLATGDFHSDFKLLYELKKNINLDEIDFILFTGDLSSQNNDFSKIMQFFKDKTFIMVRGNHENPKDLEILEQYYNINQIQNKPIIINNKIALFGSNYIPIGKDSKTEEEIFKNIFENFNKIKDYPIKIMLHHFPPFNTNIGNASPYSFIFGSLAVRFFLENFSPELLLCGHIHESSGLEEIINKTKVINVGRTFKVIEF